MDGTEAPAQPDDEGFDEMALDGLEADLEAVDRAMASLDSIAADPDVVGDASAAQVEAVVSNERFGGD